MVSVGEVLNKEDGVVNVGGGSRENNFGRYGRVGIGVMISRAQRTVQLNKLRRIGTKVRRNQNKVEIGDTKLPRGAG